MDLDFILRIMRKSQTIKNKVDQEIFVHCIIRNVRQYLIGEFVCYRCVYRNTSFSKSAPKRAWTDGWIQSERDKISTRGAQIRPNVHHTDVKLKDLKRK
jgi:hypothetical protein